MTIFNGVITRAISIIAILLFVVYGAFAQEAISYDKLEKINADIEKFGASLTEKSKEYPEIIASIREKKLKIDQAEDQVEKMISDLEVLTNKMDNDSEYRTELVGVLEKVSVLISKVEETDGFSEKDVADLKKRQEKLTDMDENRAVLVANARSTIRDLRANQAKLVLIKQMNAIDQAISILEKGLNNFEGIVKDARAIADGVNEIVAGN